MKFIHVISTLQEIIKYYYHKDGKSRVKKFLRLKTLPKQMNCLRKPIFYPINKIMMRKSNISTKDTVKNMEIGECVLGMVLANNDIDTYGLDDEC